MFFTFPEDARCNDEMTGQIEDVLTCPGAYTCNLGLTKTMNLGAALQEIATAMPYVAGQKVISTDEQGDPVYEDVGPTPRFMELARKNRKRLEAEARSATGKK